jgi:hypothetical protein
MKKRYISAYGVLGEEHSCMGGGGGGLGRVLGSMLSACAAMQSRDTRENLKSRTTNQGQFPRYLTFNCEKKRIEISNKVAQTLQYLQD